MASSRGRRCPERDSISGRHGRGRAWAGAPGRGRSDHPSRAAAGPHPIRGDRSSAEWDDRGVATDEHPIGESRWPPALACSSSWRSTSPLRIWLPATRRSRAVAGPRYRGAPVAVLLTSNPSGPAERRRLRRVALVARRPARRGGAVGDGVADRRPHQGQGRTQLAGRAACRGRASCGSATSSRSRCCTGCMDGGGPSRAPAGSIPVDFAFTST